MVLGVRRRVRQKSEGKHAEGISKDWTSASGRIHVQSLT